MWQKKFLLFQTLVLSIMIALSGCASTTLKGISPEGNNVYIGLTPIDNTEAYQQFLQSPRSELSRIQYLLRRIKDAKDIKYDRNGTYHSSEEAHQAGLWLVGNRYNNSQDAVTFLRSHVWHSKPSMTAHLAVFPDGSKHVAYYIFLNELALLDEKIQD